MISAQRLDKRFVSVHAVDDVSLELHAGEIFGLLGPNGAGKTTTLRMITSIIRPDAGLILYDGAPFSEQVRQQLGYLPEERGLYQKARIEETLIHLARLKGLDERTARKRTADWFERFGIEGRPKRRIEELSKGNQQKLQIIAALIHEPRYVIFDEPTSGLDPMNQELLRDIVVELRDQGRVILYSTHQMEQAERLCSRIALIDRGRIVLSGTTDEVRAQHAGDHVLLEFEGEGGFLRSLPPVAGGRVDPNVAELELRAGATLDDLLPHLQGRLRISRIERVRPSLNSIFISTIGKRNSASEPQEVVR